MANRKKEVTRSKYARVRVTPTEKAVLHDAAQAHGYRSLSAFTRAAWGLMLSGGGKITQQSQQTQG